MIGFISGKIIHIGGNNILIDIGNLGYIVFVDTGILSRYFKGDMISLHTYQHVREDVLALYGFEKSEHVEFFKKLITVKGVGPKSALSILSVVSADDLINAIACQDSVILTQVSGIGKKTAERIILELKNKVDSLLLKSDKQNKGKTLSEKNEVIEALIALGYPLHKARELVEKIPLDITGLSDQLTYVLKNV